MSEVWKILSTVGTGVKVQVRFQPRIYSSLQIALHLYQIIIVRPMSFTNRFL